MINIHTPLAWREKCADDVSKENHKNFTKDKIFQKFPMKTLCVTSSSPYVIVKAHFLPPADNFIVEILTFGTENIIQSGI